MGYVWRINDPDGFLKRAIASAVDLLRSPAGSRFKSLEDIRKDPEEFGRAFHKGLFRFHLITIDQIIYIEEALQKLPPATTPSDRSTRRGFQHLRQIFRTFNDCIAWIIFAPEASFIINRLCRRRERGYLLDQNPEAVLNFINNISKTGETLAIWNDATRCIDLHDVTAISLNPRRIRFIELKEGEVNEEVAKIAQSASVEDIKAGLEELYTKRGTSGVKQFERFMKQQIEGQKIYYLASNDDVEDPFLKKRRVASTPHKPFESYDKQFADFIRELRDREHVHTVIDGCMHVLGVNQERLSKDIKIDDLIHDELKARIPNPANGEPDCSKAHLSFQDTLYSPFSMPMMLRPLPPADIADICLGNKVLFFMFDMNAWGRLLSSCRLTWSKQKQGRREKSKPFQERRMIIDERVPTITSPDGARVQLGDRMIPVIMCEGISPRSLAEHYDYRLMNPEELSIEQA